MPLLWNDSSVSSTNFGTAFLPITGSSVTGQFLAENITISIPATVIQLRNQLNEPAGSIGIADFVNGSATVQASGSFPEIGARFGFGGSVFFLNEIGQTYALGEIYKANVNFTKKYN